MPKSPARVSDFEFFVLKMVEQGISTPYEFMRRGNISYGAVIPALQRLAERKLLQLKKSTTGRKRGAFRITSSGKRYLKAVWPHLLQQAPRDAESAVRMAVLCGLLGEDAKTATQMLSVAIESLDSAVHAESTPPSQSGLEMYRWMISYCDHHRRAAE